MNRNDGARGDARKRATEVQPVDTDALRTSLAWHFRCHAEEPGKSYMSLGIANAETIVARMIADAKAGAWDEGLRACAEDNGVVYDIGLRPRNPYRAEVT